VAQLVNKEARILVYRNTHMYIYIAAKAEMNLRMRK